MSAPASWPGAPLSAPVWVWIAYVVVTVALAWSATDGGFLAIVAIGLEAFVSFQFWTFAAYRGVKREVAK